MEIYTPIEKAGEIIRQRWSDEKLRKAVEEKLEGDIPEILKDGPSGLIWRQIGTPDGEFKRFLELCQKSGVKPLCFEYAKDKFHAGNFTKYGITNLAFFDHKEDNKTLVKKEKIINFDKAEKERLCDLKTLWGENLVDFHHFFLQAVFPIMKGRINDMSEWIKKKGKTPKEYYFSFLSLAICYCIYFDDYDLLESEKAFTNEIILPAFSEVKKYFGVEPIIVRISRIGEQEKDPYWWCYSTESKIIMDNHIKTFK